MGWNVRNEYVVIHSILFSYIFSHSMFIPNSTQGTYIVYTNKEPPYAKGPIKDDDNNSGPAS